jgi:EAL and modified HD-GYP domain-containing signal transduction protein
MLDSVVCRRAPPVDHSAKPQPAPAMPPDRPLTESAVKGAQSLGADTAEPSNPTGNTLTSAHSRTTPLICYAPLVDRKRRVVAMALDLLPARPGGPVDVAAELTWLAQYQLFNSPGSATVHGPLVWLRAAQVPPRDVLATLGLPAWLGCGTRAPASEPAQAPAADDPGLVFVDVAPGADAAVAIDAARRWAAAGTTLCVGGLQTLAEVECSFARGAQLVAGWPLQVPPHTGREVIPEVSVVVDLMNRVERQEPMDRLERALQAEPTLSFRLLRFIHSAAFGLPSDVIVTSLRHALLLLGYLQLQRWLSMILVDTVSRDASARPLLWLSVRRACLMERLSAAGVDGALGPELFMTGLFSLLDCLMRRPLSDLLDGLPVGPRVRSSLQGNGPYATHLELVRGLEQARPDLALPCAARMGLSAAQCNRAVAAALESALRIDGPAS